MKILNASILLIAVLGVSAYSFPYNYSGNVASTNAAAVSADATVTTDDLFLVAAANLDQCGNGGVGLPIEPCTGANWINGNVNNSKAHWFEGQSIAYRQLLTGFTVGSSGNTVTIGFDTTKVGKHALDYLTSFDRTETLAMGNNPCSGVVGCSLGTFTTFPIPVDANVTAGFDQIPANGDDITQIPGVFTLFGGTITGVSGYTLSGTYAGDSHTTVTITFTADSANMVLAWGGHIGTRANWGANNTAVVIVGSPYHMSQDACSFGCGAQDRALSSIAVWLNSQITIVQNAAPESVAVFGYTTTGTGLSAFSLRDDGVDNDATPNNTSFLTLLAPATQGAFTVTNSTLPAGYQVTNLTCLVSPGGTSTTGVNLPVRQVSITLQYGDTVTCSFFANITTAANVSLSGRVLTADGQGIRGARVVISGNVLSQPIVATTGSFGYYNLDSLEAGETYIVTVNSKRFTFTMPSRVVNLDDSVADVDFVADPQ